MRFNFSSVLVGCAVALLAIGAYAQVRSREQPDPPTGAYRVTLFPPHTDPGHRYTQELEAYLNRMASEGWRFRSTLVAQNRGMMLFERAREP